MNKIGGFWLLGISIILLGTSVFLNISNTTITNESIVLGFVGILATFIVVGNYAQVTEIRNSTENQIKILKNETEKKINNLDALYEKVNEASKRIEKIERDTEYNAAEAYRLYGIVLIDKKSYRNATRFLLNSISLYFKCDRAPLSINTLLNVVVNNFKTENWNNKTEIEIKFNYQTHIDIVIEFPDKYAQKQIILNELNKYINGE